MVHRQAALPEQLLDVTVAQRITQIPGDRPQDQRGLEVAALEVVLGPALQPLGNRTQDHEVPPNRRAKLAAMPDGPSTPEICDRPCYRAVPGSNEIRSFMPVAAASRSSVRVDGLTRPLSRRAITACVVFMRWASCSCVSPALARALIISAASEHSSSSAL